MMSTQGKEVNTAGISIHNNNNNSLHERPDVYNGEADWNEWIVHLC